MRSCWQVLNLIRKLVRYRQVRMILFKPSALVRQHPPPSLPLFFRLRASTLLCLSCDVSRIQIALEFVFHWKTRRYLHFSICHNWRHTTHHYRHYSLSRRSDAVLCVSSRAMFGQGKAGVSRNHLQILFPAIKLETTSHCTVGMNISILAGLDHLFDIFERAQAN